MAAETVDEAAFLLAELYAEVDRIRASFASKLPASLATLLGVVLTIGERYAREADVEAGRGWNAVELLRELPELVRQCVQNTRDVALGRFKTGHGFIELTRLAG